MPRAPARPPPLTPRRALPPPPRSSGFDLPPASPASFSSADGPPAPPASWPEEPARSAAPSAADSSADASPRASDGAAASAAPGPPPSRSWARRLQSKAGDLRRLFALPPGEPLLDDFACALRKRVLLQGRLYAFERHLAFHASLFGYHKARVVPLADVVDVAKRKNVGLPNSIEVAWRPGGAAAGGPVRREFFTSFVRREDAYRLLLGLWAAASEAGRARAAADEEAEAAAAAAAEAGGRAVSFWWRAARPAPTDAAPRSGSEAAAGDGEGSGDTSPTASEATAAAAGAALAEPPRPGSWERLSPVPEAASLMSEGEDAGGIATAESLRRRAAAPSAAAPGVGASPSTPPAPAKGVAEFEPLPDSCESPGAIDAEFDAASTPVPPVPEGMQRVLACTLPTTPRGFHAAFLCGSSDFFPAFHASQGHHSVTLGRWQRHYAVGPVRDLTFVTPLKGWRMGPSETLCHQTQRYDVCAGDRLVFETTQAMADIPYGDHFRVNTRWDVAPGATPGSCDVVVHVAVPFTKSTIWKRYIEKSVADSALEAYGMFRDLAWRALEGGGAGGAGGAGAAGASANEAALAEFAAATSVELAAAAAAPAAPSPGGAPRHRRAPSRVTSPEEVLPATEAEWAALMEQVEPQWRGGLRALRRGAQAPAAGDAPAASPLAGAAPRHRRRPSGGGCGLTRALSSRSLRGAEGAAGSPLAAPGSACATIPECKPGGAVAWLADQRCSTLLLLAALLALVLVQGAALLRLGRAAAPPLPGGAAEAAAALAGELETLRGAVDAALRRARALQAAR